MGLIMMTLLFTIVFYGLNEFFGFQITIIIGLSYLAALHMRKEKRDEG